MQQTPERSCPSQHLANQANPSQAGALERASAFGQLQDSPTTCGSAPDCFKEPRLPACMLLAPLQLVADAMAELGLTKVADTFVGSAWVRGVSGGA